VGKHYVLVEIIVVSGGGGWGGGGGGEGRGERGDGCRGGGGEKRGGGAGGGGGGRGGGGVVGGRRGREYARGGWGDSVRLASNIVRFTRVAFEEGTRRGPHRSRNEKNLVLDHSWHDFKEKRNSVVGGGGELASGINQPK